MSAGAFDITKVGTYSSDELKNKTLVLVKPDAFARKLTGEVISRFEAKGFVSRELRHQTARTVNICDEELLGRTLREGKLKVDITPDYFSGVRVDEETALKQIKETDIVNLVGNRIVAKALKEKLGHPRAGRKIEEVSFLMIYKFSV